MYPTPGRVAVTALVALDVTLFVLANIPRFRTARHGTTHVVAGALWMGFLAGTLALLITLALGITRAIRRNRPVH